MENIKLRDDYLVFGAPLITDKEIDEVVNTLKSGWIGTGPKVSKFEDAFKEYLGVKHAIAVSSCTAGLHLSIIALGIQPGDEVIVPTMTFVASVNAIIHAGAKPVLVDCDKEKFTIDLEDVRRKITPKTKAIVPVHFAGRACDIDGINRISKEHNLKVLHDTAHAIETEYKGLKIGGYDDISSYSFYVTKNLTTSEGGMVTTNDDEMAAKIKIFALHGMSKDAWKRFSDDGYRHYEVLFPGFKYNMTDIQASLGIHQLADVENNYKRRQEVWHRYNEELKGLPLILPNKLSPDSRHALHLYTILLDTEKVSITRDEMITKLHKLKVGTGVHYRAVHYHPYYQETYGYKIGDFPNAEFISERTLSIPLSAKLSDDDIHYVISAIKSIFV